MIFETHDNTILFHDCIRAKKCWASILVIHGLGEHSGRYKEFAKFCTKLGLDVFLLDLRGHGRSQGIRGHFESMEQLHEDLNAWMEHLTKAQEISEDKPVFLFGHSLGGLVALTWSAQYIQQPLYPSLDFLILSAPALGVRKSSVQALEAHIAKVVPQFFRAFQVPSGILPEHLSHDPAEVRKYEKDPLVHGWITPSAYLAMEEAIQSLIEIIPGVDIPALFLLCGRDPVVNTDAVRSFANKLSVARPGSVEIKLFHSFFHEALHETKRERTYRELKRWILKCRISNKNSWKSSASVAIARENSH